MGGREGVEEGVMGGGEKKGWRRGDGRERRGGGGVMGGREGVEEG